jgi:hypothetical protein
MKSKVSSYLACVRLTKPLRAHSDQDQRCTTVLVHATKSARCFHDTFFDPARARIHVDKTQARLRLHGTRSISPLSWVHRACARQSLPIKILSTYADYDRRPCNSSTRSVWSSQLDSRSKSQLSMVHLHTMSTSPSLSWCLRLANKRNV